MPGCGNLADMFCTIERCEELESRIQQLEEQLRDHIQQVVPGAHNLDCNLTVSTSLTSQGLTVSVNTCFGSDSDSVELDFCSNSRCDQIEESIRTHTSQPIPGAHNLDCSLNVGASASNGMLTFNVSSCFGSDSASVEIPTNDFDLDDLFNTIANILDILNSLRNQQNNFCTREECNNITNNITNEITNIINTEFNNRFIGGGGGGNNNGGADSMPCDLNPVLNRIDQLEEIIRTIRDALEVGSSSQVTIGECRQPNNDEASRFIWETNNNSIQINGEGLDAVYQYCQAILQKLQAVHESSCMGVQLTTTVNPIEEIPVTVCRTQESVDAENESIRLQIAEGSLPSDTPLAQRLETVVFTPDNMEDSSTRLQAIAPVAFLTRFLPIIARVGARLWSRIDPNTRRLIVGTVIEWVVTNALDGLASILKNNLTEQTRALCEMSENINDADINLIIPQNTDFLTQVKESLLIAFVQPSSEEPGTLFKPINRSRWTRQIPAPTNRAKGLDSEGNPLPMFDIYNEFYNTLILRVGDIFATIILSRVIRTPEGEELINTAKITGRYANEQAVIQYTQFMLGSDAPTTIRVNNFIANGNPFGNRGSLTRFNVLQEIRMVNCGDPDNEGTVLRPYIIRVKQLENTITRIQAP